MTANQYEKVLHKKLVKFLRLYQKKHRFSFFHIKNDVGKRMNGFFFDLKALGVLPGVSDFCIIKPREIVFLEIKTLKGKLTKNQKAFLKDLKSMGHKGYVAYGWENIINTVETIINKENKMKKKWTGYFNLTNAGGSFKLISHESRDMPIWSFPGTLLSGQTRVKFEFFDYEGNDPTEEETPSGKIVYQNDNLVFSVKVVYKDGDYKFITDVIESDGTLTVKPVGESLIVPEINTNISIQLNTPAP